MALRIEGYAIVSADGMLADEHGVMPSCLLIDVDQEFLSDGLDQASLIVHGKNSHEQQVKSPYRKRLITTRAIAGLVAAGEYPSAWLWNPQSVSLEEASAELGVVNGTVAVLGGTEVYGMFLGQYDVFNLSRIESVRLPRGRAVFPDVPGVVPHDVLTKNGLIEVSNRILDPAHGVTLTVWHRLPNEN